jgi:MFS family permease
MREAPPAPPAALAYAASAPPPTRDPRMWRLGAGSALLVVAQSALLGFLVLFLHDARGLSPALAAGALAAVQLAAAGTRVLAGRRSDQRGLRLPMLREIARRNAVLLALVAALAGAPSALLYPVLLCAAVSTMTWNGLAFTAAAEMSGRLRAGTAMSLQNTIVAVGGALAPVAFGLLVDATSWTAGFAACAIAPALAVLVLAPLETEEAERVRRRENRPQTQPATLPA